jgi:hypothetical protein
MSENDINRSKGGQNRFTLWCRDLEQHRMYGSCLCLMDAYEAGRISADERYADCAQAMKRGSCAAIAAREEELAAGKSIYYRPPNAGRVVHDQSSAGSEMSEGFQRGWQQVGRALGKDEPVKVAPKPVVNKQSGLVIENVDMAKVISDNMVEKVSNADFVKMKRQVIELMKTDVAAAKQLLSRVKRIEQSGLVV